MNLRTLLAVTAATGLLAAAGAAGAAITVTDVEVGNIQGPVYLNGNKTILDWDSPIAAGFAFTGPDVPGATYQRDGSLGLDPGQSAPPPTGTGAYETTNYYTVTSNGGPHEASLTVLGGNFLKKFSFYLGSPDAYNYLNFYSDATLVASLSGPAIWSGTWDDVPFQGDQSWGYRVYYDLGGSNINKITFRSTGNSFEFDGLAGVVPEPASWALMILGFGGVGAALRSRRRLVFA